MAREDDLNQMISTLYASSTDPKAWAGGLSLLTDFAGGVATNYLLYDKMTGEALNVMTKYYSDEMNRLYLEHYAPHDVPARVAARAPVGKFFSCAEFVTDDMVKRNPFYNEFFMPAGSRYMAAVRLIDTDRFLVITGIHRSPKQGPFLRKDIEELQILSPHLVGASKMLHRFMELRSVNTQATAALDLVPWGVVVVDRNARVLSVNKAADALIQSQDSIRLRRGKIEAGNHDQTNALHGLIHRATSGLLGAVDVGGSLACDHLSGCGQFTIVVSPLLDTEATDGLLKGMPRGAILFVSDSHERPAVPTTMLMKLFGLTRAEAAVATALAAGKSIGEIAEETAVSHNTVRNQAQSILDKTNTRRQAEFVHLVLSLPTTRRRQ